MIYKTVYFKKIVYNNYYNYLKYNNYWKKFLVKNGIRIFWLNLLEF